MTADVVTNRFLGLAEDFDPSIDPEEFESIEQTEDDTVEVVATIPVTVKWTEDQQNLLTWYDEIIRQEGTSFNTVNGSAGTGKTYATADMIRRVKELHAGERWYRVGVMAPTNKAVGVLAGKLDDFKYQETTDTEQELIDAGFHLDYAIYDDDDKVADPHRVYVGTVHRFLKAIPNSADMEADDNELIFNMDAEKEERPIYRMDALFIDESSMITEGFFKLIQDNVKAGIKVFFIGDAYQLFPVDNTYKVSPVFTEVSSTYNLTEVVRYSGSILRIATRLREAMEDGNIARAYSFQKMATDDFTVVKNPNGYNGTDWYRLLVDYVKEQHEQRLPADYVRALVYKRRTRETLNNQLRREIFGMNSERQFIEGEWLFTHAQCSNYISMTDRNDLLRARDSNDPGYGEMQKRIKDQLVRLPNAKDIKVTDCEICDELLPCPTEDLQDWWRELTQSYCKVTVRTYAGEIEVPVLTASQLEDFANNKQTIIQVCDTRGYRSNLIVEYLSQMNKCFNVTEQLIKKVYDNDRPYVYNNLGYNGYPGSIKVGSKIQSGMVLTVHQSQGSTFEHVFPMYSDFFSKHPEVDPLDQMALFYRLTYTALTRASKSVKLFSKY